MLRALMGDARKRCAALPFVIGIATATTLLVDPAHAEGPRADLDQLLLDTGRPELASPDPDSYRFQVHGEEQIRFQMQRRFPLVPTATALAGQPTLVEQSHRQNYFLHHW